jgi:PKD repeat protein
VSISATDQDSPGASLSAVATGLPAGLSLAIASTSGDGVLPGSRAWTVAGATTAAPGSYPVTVTVTDETGGSGSTTFTIVVTQEDAEATYSGDMLAFTASGGSTANVLLRATLRDSSLVAAFADSQPGDIRNATVTFMEGATTLCGPLPVALIDGETTTGTASCSVTLGLGAHQIDVVVGNYYTGGTSAMLEVAQPDGSFVTGGGFLTIDRSAGAYLADEGSPMNFGFNVKHRNLRNLQGHANVIFRSGGRTYQIKSTALTSLGIVLRGANGRPCSGPPSATCFGVADFRSKANLADVTDPNAPVSLGGNLTLQITMTDKGEPGSADTIGVTLWDGNRLLFSSEWRGTRTLEMLLAGGNLVVH